MKNLAVAMLYLVLLILSSMRLSLADENRYWWTGIAVGTEAFNGNYNGAALTGGWFPTPGTFDWKNFDWGVQGYVETGHYDYYDGEGDAISVGVEPVITWNGAYAGVGMALGNTTPNLGTFWNFSLVDGYRHCFNKNWCGDALFRHKSHFEAAGIETDKSNTGTNFVGFQLIYRF